jgi:CubicO group peptidase (beta-lactamase class C family)
MGAFAGGYDAPRNALVTWKMHLQQESEWEGSLWGKSHDFVGREAFGEGERKPRALQAPGTHYEYNDVRINRFALSLLRTFGQPVPDVFRTEVMEPIGASSTWKWVPYTNSYVDVGGRRMASVSGGTRWGGGLWIHAWDMARFGYLWLRGGRWGDRQILPPAFVKAALTPSAHGPDYGYLWWLNTQGKNLPGMPSTAYSARGAGGNTITISPDHDLVVVLRWQQGNEAEVVKRVIASIR